MDNPWKAFIKTVLDTGTVEKELKKLQKKLQKQTLHVPVKIDQESLLDSVKKAVPKLASSIKIPGIQVPVAVSQQSAGAVENKLKAQFQQAGQRIAQKLSISSGAMLLYSKTKQSITEIKELDRILNQISKTSNLTSKQLAQLGIDAYSTAGKYGKTAGEYLTAIDKMSRSGFTGNKGASLTEQSLLAQTAGSMDAELANQYILATNAAYKLNGEAEKINAVLDGQNNISIRNNIAMTDMAAAMNEAGKAASQYQVSMKDLSAMIGTVEAVTQLSGSEAGSGITAILNSLQDESSDQIIDMLNAANASMTEMANGSKKLRNPVSILRDLAETYESLEENDPLRARILTDIGPADHIDALLQNMDLFDQMLTDYSEGKGSALEEANRQAANLTGSLRTLSNSWTEFVNSMVNSSELKTGANLLNTLVQGAANLSQTLTPAGTLGLGAGLIASLKNSGRAKTLSLSSNMPVIIPFPVQRAGLLYYPL